MRRNSRKLRFPRMHADYAIVLSSNSGELLREVSCLNKQKSDVIL